MLANCMCSGQHQVSVVGGLDIPTPLLYIPTPLDIPISLWTYPIWTYPSSGRTHPAIPTSRRDLGPGISTPERAWYQWSPCGQNERHLWKLLLRAAITSEQSYKSAGIVSFLFYFSCHHYIFLLFLFLPPRSTFTKEAYTINTNNIGT